MADLDAAHVEYSYLHTTLVTLTVDGQYAQRNNPTNAQEWHLPTFDPRNENKYMYRLHTVDIYFWSKEDALVFVNGVQRVLPGHQITLKDEPSVPAPHPQDMSPVVQQLENVAISDPSYQQGQTRNSRTTSSSLAPTFSGPPISATPQSQEAVHFSPMAYNPAAPAAPEAIKHREKTPPPEDGAGNPLVAAAASDQGQTYGQPYQHPGQIQQNYFPGSVPSALSSPYTQQFTPTPSFAPPPFSPTFSGPPQQPQQPQQPSFAPPPQNPTPPGPPAYSTGPGHVPVTQYANYAGSPMSTGSGMTTPGLFSPGFPHSTPGGGNNFQPSTPGAPPGGFASFNYSSSQGQLLMNDYSIHQQLYRPTEGEHAVKTKPKKEPRGKLEENAGRLEKGVSGILKKFEKKYG